MAHNFEREESHVEAPNFYRKAAEVVFPELGLDIEFLPDLRGTFLARALRTVGLPDGLTKAVVLVSWFIPRRKNYDVVIGWLSNGVTVAIVKALLRGSRPKVCLVLYRIRNEPKLRALAQRLVYRVASIGTDLLLALDRTQAIDFARILRRSDRQKTDALVYGVDSQWYEQRWNYQGRGAAPRIFSPGGAYRDDETLRRAVQDLDVEVTRYRLAPGGPQPPRSERVGRANIIEYESAPYSEYVKASLEARLVVIAVENRDKPVGLTSLLECMALGRPIIATRGLSSHDYVRDGETALLYEQGNADDLRTKIRRLLEDDALAMRLGESARRACREDYDLAKRGRDLGMKLREIAGP